MIRLLTRDSDGKLILREFDDHDIPAYAILSHTWNADNSQEVTFDDDLNPDPGEEKNGHRKISFCEEKAAAAGLRYFWIDTCCINKRSEPELSEAINSMFRWYQKAIRCYVYLSDVSASSDELLSPHSWQRAFRRSRWFTRGWTLQELIAPRAVEFFTKDGQRLGDKVSLESMVQEITGIYKMALRGHPLSEFSVEERKSWAEHRSTKKQEDGIYSLLGIFGVTMPLIYGEGKDKAWRRLDEEISKLSKAPEFDKFGVDTSLSRLHETIQFVRHGKELEEMRRMQVRSGYGINQSTLGSPIKRQFTGEEKWGKIMESRRKNGRCLNCGSEVHWEYKCPENCGLYPGHNASKCRFPIRCMECQEQGHIAKDCPDRGDMQDFWQSLGKTFNDTRNPETKKLYRELSALDSTSYNQERDVLSPSDALKLANLEAALDQLARDKDVHLKWRVSIVDLLKLLGLNSNLNARERLAEELQIRIGPTGSAAQNVALHKKLMKELASNDGRVSSRIYECTRKLTLSC